jgi:DNA recombination protein RmuC
MEVIIALVSVIVILAIALTVVLRRQPTTNTYLPPALPTLTAAEIRDVIREIHSETLRDLAGQAKDDRDDAISVATREMGNAIEQAKKQIDETIGRVETELDRLREANSEKFGNVDHAVAQLSAQAAALTKVLSSAQGRGNWGERMLEDILSNSGFKKGTNYDVQETLSEGGRPDYSFYLPPNRVVYLDSKFPLENYLKYCDTKDEATRKIYRENFLKNVEQRVKELEKRDYANQGDRQALDSVLLFIPNDGVVAFIQENKPTLIDEAARKKVVFCSPLTLYMFLSMMHQAASSFYMEQNANEVLRLLGRFDKAWMAYVKYVNGVFTNFNNLQKKLKAITKGKIFRGVETVLQDVREVAQTRGIEADASGAVLIDELISEIEDSDDEEGDTDDE